MSAQELILTDGLVTCEITPESPFQSASTTNSGASIVVEYGPTVRWRLRAATHDSLSREDYGAWEAWIARRKGAAVSFTAYRLYRARPAGDAIIKVDNSKFSLSSISAANSTVTISTSTSVTFKPGDLLSYKAASGGYWLGMVTAKTNGAASQTINVTPAPVTAHASPDFRATRAIGEFRLDGAPRLVDDWKTKTRSVSFEAIQVSP